MAYAFLKSQGILSQSREQLLELVMQHIYDDNPLQGINLANEDAGDLPPNDISADVERVPTEKENAALCEICYLDHPDEDMRTPLSCEHRYCKFCYMQYLEDKIKSNQVREIEIMSTN